MKKSQLHKLIKEELENLLRQEEEGKSTDTSKPSPEKKVVKVNVGGHEFNMALGVNKNPTKEGIKIHLRSLSSLDDSEKNSLSVKVQQAFNTKFKVLGLPINIDTDADQSVGFDTLSFFITLNNLGVMLKKALEPNGNA
jgi:hypothetical protein